MIIEAKANREPPEVTDPRKPYESTPEKVSRLSIYFAMLITGLAAFLKSAFPARSVEEQAGPEGVRDAAIRDTSRGIGTEPGTPLLVDDTVTASIGSDRPGFGVLRPSGSWEGGFTLIDPLSLNYTASFDLLGPQVAAFFPAAFSLQPENDNDPPRGGGATKPAVAAPVEAEIETAPDAPAAEADTGVSDDDGEIHITLDGVQPEMIVGSHFA